MTYESLGGFSFVVLAVLAGAGLLAAARMWRSSVRIAGGIVKVRNPLLSKSLALEDVCAVRVVEGMDQVPTLYVTLEMKDGSTVACRGLSGFAGSWRVKRAREELEQMIATARAMSGDVAVLRAAEAVDVVSVDPWRALILIAAALSLSAIVVAIGLAVGELALAIGPPLLLVVVVTSQMWSKWVRH